MKLQLKSLLRNKNVRYKLLACLLLLFPAERGYSQCAIQETLVADPVPVDGKYLTGTSVTFCYSLHEWIEYGNNYIHGFIIKLGPGWDSTTLIPLSYPNSCSGKGLWGFFQKDTSFGTGKVFGMGFYFDFVPKDNLPGNNYGDQSTGSNCEWNFCFSVKTKSICDGSDLSISVTATGDGTTGGWGNPSCQGIPLFTGTATCYSLVDGIEKSKVKNEDIVLYPNPATGQLEISGLALEAGGEVAVTDFLGRVMQRTVIATPISNFKLQILNYPSGVYFIQITMDKDVTVKKFVKE